VALVLDTGPILALLDAGDPAHARSVAMVEELREDLIIPSCVLVEVDYWARKLLGPTSWDILVEDITSGAYRLEPLTIDDLTRTAELERQYEDLDLGLVDASVIALCERINETKVATLDRRDFSVVRPNHCDALHLLPA
jgi:predicted nucleic acid-binding protein